MLPKGGEMKKKPVLPILVGINTIKSINSRSIPSNKSSTSLFPINAAVFSGATMSVVQLITSYKFCFDKCAPPKQLRQNFYQQIGLILREDFELPPWITPYNS